jgi:hypothetical protein
MHPHKVLQVKKHGACKPQSQETRQTLQSIQSVVISAKSDPMAAYLTYLADVTGGAVGNMDFTLEDFKTYIAELRQRR